VHLDAYVAEMQGLLDGRSSRNPKYSDGLTAISAAAPQMDRFND
jgi:hypothetical protein